MPFLSRSKTLHWTFHARAKMNFYKLSEQRVRQVLHCPKRIEEGVAPKTTAMMQPVSVKRVKSQESSKMQETWIQEIWVMVEKRRQGSSVRGQETTKVISAWRYPGMSKPRSEVLKNALRQEYGEYSSKPI